jgi:hypothetical protein
MSFLRNIESAFWSQGKNLVKENEKFKDIHKGETCFILGNGASLKHYDLSVLSDKVTMGCTYSLIDKRLISTGLNYCVFPSAYLMFPLWRCRGTKKGHIKGGDIQLNSLSPIFKKIIKDNNKTQFFISLTDRYAFLKTPENISYTYHFGNKNGYSYDMSGCFNVMTGALDMMLGTAKYLGFSKVVLLGCDYLGSPSMNSHFYSVDKPLVGKVMGDYKADYGNRIKKVADELKLDVLTIFPKGIKSPVFESKSFFEYFGLDEQYHNQSQIIIDDYYDMVKLADSKRQVHMLNDW